MAMLFFNCSMVFAEVDVGNWIDMKSEIESGNSVNVNSDINVGDFIHLGSDKTVTVNANLHDFAIGENYRIFNNLGNLTINNANFNDGISSAVGMIYNEGQLTINGGMFNNNLAWDGGALYLVDLSRTNVENTVFRKNAATGYGGAIYNAGDLTLSNVTIGGDNSEDANTAQKGAGVYNSNKITINGGSFKNNLATNAGALYLTSSATAQINGTIFDSNTAFLEANPSSANGGAIYSEGNLNITGGSYINNTAWDGGALYLKSTSISIIEDAIFKKNAATGYGGAIYNAGDLTLSNTTIGGDSSEDANTAIQGAGVYNSNKITINGGSFKNNLATSAGALYLTSSATAQINGTIFDSNTAFLEANPSSANGGAIYSEGNLNIAGGSYINNTAWDGGALYLKSTSTSIIEDATFKKNTASGYGGAIYNEGDLTLTDSIFGGSLSTDSNLADHGGAIFNKGILNINGGSFKNSSATNGGALYLNSSSMAEIEGTAFSANKSTSQGGAIYNNGTLTLTDVNFGEKTGSGTTEDPYVYSNGNTTTISSGYQGGGAIFNNSSTLNIYGNSNFYGNSVISASDYGSAGGGAIFNNAGDLNIISDKDGISFVNNSALSGGAIYNSGNVTLENVTFGIKTGAGTDEDPFVYSNGNIANTKGGYQGGGAIFNSSGTINLKGDINFYGNTTTATDDTIVSIGGGAIYINQGNIITSEADNIVFEANSATSGGSIYNSGNTTLTNAVFGSRTGTGTTEDPYIYANGNSATAKGGYQGGGAIYTLGTIVINGNSSFYGNKAETTEVNSSNGGGAIYSNSANVTINSDISDIILAGNTAYKGGAVYNNGGTVNLLATSADIIFSENTASSIGGAFYNSGTINMTASGADILFDNNYAINNGGDIYNDYGTVNLRAAQDNKIVFDDTIYNYSSWASININQTKDDTDYLGTIEFNNEVSGIYDPTINLYNGILKLGHTMQSDGKTLRSTGSISSNKLALFGGTIDMMDGQTGNFIDVPLLSIAKDSTINLKFDVDLSTSISDYIKSNSAIENAGSGSANGIFNISDINILKDSATQNTTINLFKGTNLPSPGQIAGATIDTTLYRYIVSQDSTNLGNLLFTQSNIYDLFYTAIKADTSSYNLTLSNNAEVDQDINEMLGTTDKTVEVNGNGNSINGNGYKGVIIGNSQTLTLNNIGSESVAESGYKNFNSTSGGAINNSGTLNITNTIFRDNSASEEGGAIYNGAALTINGGSFINNTAFRGGAIYNTGENAVININTNINNVSFLNNSSAGGAIFNVGNLNFNATNGNIIFADNTSDFSGGAITSLWGVINLVTDGGTIIFSNNTSESGGSIFNQTGEINLIANSGNINFTTNTSTSYASSIYNIQNAITNIIANGADINFINNTSYYDGAIYNINSSTTNIITNGGNITFSGNKATNGSSYGGAISNAVSSTVNITANTGDITFLDNTVSSYGGAIYNNSSTLNLTSNSGDIVFSNNKANTGGAIYNTGGTVNLKSKLENKIKIDDTVHNNNGSAKININQSANGINYLGTVEFNNSVSGASNPTINLYNGILKLGHTMQSDGKTLRSIGSISSNKLALFGGTIDMMDSQTGNFINAPTLSIAKGSTIGLKFDVDLSTSISDYIKSNSAISNTGTGTVNGVFNIADINILSDATSDNTSISLFTGSYTPSLGQIVGTTIDTTLYRYIVSQDSTNLGNLIFNKSNLYDDFYTAIKSDTDYENFAFNSDINIERDINEMLGAVDKTVEVNGNDKSIDGNGYKGVIIGNSQTLTLNNIGSESVAESGYKNFNSTSGGAINNSGTLNINNSILRDNSASEKGGAIYNTGETNIASSTIKTNESAGNGGAIHNALNATLNISGETSFLDNTAQGLGGAIYNEGTLNLIADNANILFSGNKDTDTNSNAIYMNGGELNMNASESQSIIFNDSIKSFDNTSEININAGSENNSGTIVLNADMSNYIGDVNIYSGILKLGNQGIFFGNSSNQIDLLMSENATIDLQNGKIDSIDLNSFTGGGKFNIDANLNLGLADNILVLNANQTENVIISGISILSDKTSNQRLKIFSDNITINDFSIKATTSSEKYLITKDPSNEGYIYITYKGKVGDALVELLEDDGNRSYTLTNSIYTASLDLPYLNASDDESVNNLEIFGQNKTFFGDNKFSMFKVDTTNALYGQNVPRELTIHNATVSNARAEEGSALLIKGQGANATLDNATIRDNISTGNGGAVNISAGGSLTVPDGGGFYNNTSISGQGGAVYLEGDSTNPATLTLISKTRNTVFGNNIAGSEQNSIYMAGNSIVNINNSSTNKLVLPTAILTSGDNNTLNINKPIDSIVTTGNFDIDIDYSGFKGNNNSVNLYNGTLALKDGGKFFGNTPNASDYINFAMMNNSTLDLQNTAIDTIYLNSLNIIGNAAKAKLDIDLTNHAADTIISSSIIGTPVLNIDSFNIISNAVTDSLFEITSPNITINYTGTESYYTNDYYYNISKNSTSNKIRFASTFIGGDGLTRSLSNIGTRTYSMVLDSKGIPETYTATSNLPSLNAEYAEGRTNKVTVYGNSGNISGNSLYSLFKIDSSDNVQRNLDIQNITLRNALSDKGSALSIIGSKSTVNSSNIQFKNNKSTNKGGAIYLKDGAQLNISGNSKFENNTAQGQGGAIYASGTSSDISKINLTAAASNTIEFSGNKQNSTESNAIFLDGHSELNLKSLAATSKIVFNDKIKSSGEGNVININKADTSTYTGTTTFNADMSGYEGELNLFNGTLQLAKNNMQFNTSNFNIYQNATLDMRNATIDNLNISNLNLINSKAYLNVDIDGLTQKADTIKSNGASGNLTINRFNILSDLTATASNPIEISKTEGLNIIADTTTQYLGPIYKYNISSAGDNRSIILTKTSINPVVLSSPVTSTVGTYSNVLNSYEQAFTNSDTFMMQPYIQRLAYRMKDRVAINEVKGYEPIYSEQVAGVWFRPYTTFENVELKNGPSVSNISYGSFVGFDLPLEEKKFGFQKVIGAYAGYNGVHQKYDDVSVYQNGGLIGLTQSFYKDNFFTSLTANVSASAADSSSSHARSEFTTMTAGLASKTGYNLEFLESKFIIQPSIMLAYSFIKTFDYKNSNSTQFTSNPLSVFQINPGLKFISNFKSGYQPYLGVNMVWNITGGGNFKANDTYLPAVSVKPYVEYGLGVQKRWGEKLTGYAQSMVRNGGRNGVSLQFGLKWAL